MFRPFWGRIPLLFNTFWGDYSAGTGRYKLPIDLYILYTLPETNIAPENGWLED